MKIICPGHGGFIRLDENLFDATVEIKNLVVECPVCDDEVLIEGVFDFDAKGVGTPRPSKLVKV